MDSLSSNESPSNQADNPSHLTLSDESLPIKRVEISRFDSSQFAEEFNKQLSLKNKNSNPTSTTPVALDLSKNPQLESADLAYIQEVAHQNHCQVVALVVDDTNPTPWLLDYAQSNHLSLLDKKPSNPLKEGKVSDEEKIEKSTNTLKPPPQKGDSNSSPLLNSAFISTITEQTSQIYQSVQIPIKSSHRLEIHGNVFLTAKVEAVGGVFCYGSFFGGLKVNLNASGFALAYIQDLRSLDIAIGSQTLGQSSSSNWQDLIGCAVWLWCDESGDIQALATDKPHSLTSYS